MIKGVLMVAHTLLHSDISAPHNLYRHPDAGVEAHANSETIVKDYLVALRNAFDGDATSDEIDRIADMFAVDGIVEHPRANARVDGRDAIRRGLASHIGDYVAKDGSRSPTCARRPAW